MMIIKINLNQNKDIPETDVLFWVDKRFFNLNQEKMKKENKKVQTFKAEYTVHEMALIRRSMEHYLSDWLGKPEGWESMTRNEEEKDIIKKWLKDDFFGRLLKGATKIAEVVVADGKMTMTKVGESKMTANGISTTTELGSEQYEVLRSGRKPQTKSVQYDYRHTNGKLFSCVKRTLAECRDAKCEWLKGQGTVQYYLNGFEENLNYILDSTNAQEVARQGSAEKNNLIIWFQTTDENKKGQVDDETLIKRRGGDYGDDNVIKEKTKHVPKDVLNRMNEQLEEVIGKNPNVDHHKERNILSNAIYDKDWSELNEWQYVSIANKFITGNGELDAKNSFAQSMYGKDFGELDTLQDAMITMKFDKEKVAWKFLDYEIVNSWNSDGFVITKEHNEDCSNIWECHLGNYATIEDAMKSCVLHFMIARPESFNGNVHARMLKSGGGLYREFSTFKEVCEKEGIEIPKEVTHSDDLNHSICFKGIKV